MATAESGGPRWLAAACALFALAHVGEGAATRAALDAGVGAADAFAKAEAGRMRESVLLANGNAAGLDRDVRAGLLVQAMKLRQPTSNGQGIDQLQARVGDLRKQASKAEGAGMLYGEAEIALGLAAALFVLMGAVERRLLGRVARALVGVGAVLALAGLSGLFSA